MNKVMLIGNVGQDPVVRYLDNGVCVASVRLATTERGYTLQNGTQVPDRTEWHSLIFWRKQAETVEKFVHKGDKLYVEGKIQSRKYDDRQGVTHQVVEIMVDQMEMLTPRSSTPATANDAPQQTPTQQVVTPSQNDDEPPF
ncbi:MAG: single-stranded DNA-binding protein [Bacteroidaceae bacterium]|jgi:single-strand DNA-binding protein|nr:single-stranded DNA-binding protein [Bacteroidaceae bacterium]